MGFLCPENSWLEVSSMLAENFCKIQRTMQKTDILLVIMNVRITVRPKLQMAIDQSCYV